MEDLKTTELRKALRHFDPSTRGVGGLAHSAPKEAVLDHLRRIGVMESEVREYLAGAEIEAPREANLPFIENGKPEVIIDVEPIAAKEESAEPKKVAPLASRLPDGVDELEIIRTIITRNAKAAVEVDEGKVRDIFRDEFTGYSDDIDRKIEGVVENRLAKMVKRVEVKRLDGSKVDLGIVHEKTPEIIQIVQAEVNLMLVGPAGGGKTTACDNVAKALDLEFFPMSVGPQTTKSDLLGFIDATGNYHASPVRRAFENGGLLLIDELDAANAGVLTILNALLSNGYCSFPDKTVEKNDKFRCVGACNTFGRGADRQYVGRNQLDAATLDRFVVVNFDYDESFEKTLAGNDEWTAKVQKWRKRAADMKLRIVISPRASIHGARLLSAGVPEPRVEEMVVWKGVAKDVVAKVRG